MTVRIFLDLRSRPQEFDPFNGEFRHVQTIGNIEVTDGT
jgi:hypothetical protein